MVLPTARPSPQRCLVLVSLALVWTGCGTTQEPEVLVTPVERAPDADGTPDAPVADSAPPQDAPAPDLPETSGVATPGRASCDPCDADSVCGAPAGRSAVCVGLGLPAGSLGHFCALTCLKDTDCGTGQFCQAGTSIGGVPASACVPKTGGCGCSAEAVAKGWSSPCYKSTSGTAAVCKGVRTCSTKGLSACSASDPKAETCNGQDDDCNGLTDEVASGQSLCDDGNPCTKGETCQSGKCTAGESTCGCQTDSDCAGFDDGNPCNGKLFCDKGSQPWTCRTVPNSEIKCTGGGPCAVSTCDPATGGCVATPANEGGGCDADGLACTVGDACKGGKCVAGSAGGCDDNNPCTTDTCDAKGTCAHAPASGPCDDGNPCTGGDSCSGGQCQSTSKSCDDGNPCTVDGCDTATGSCTHDGKPLDGKACPTADACSTTAACQAGKCQALSQKVCDDGNPCTADTCDSVKGCVSTPQDGPCQDGNACTGPDACKAGQCAPGPSLCACQTDADCAAQAGGDLCMGKLFCDKSGAKPACAVVAGTKPTCPAGGPCAAVACEPSTGQCKTTPVPDGKSCDADGSVCTQGDACAGGSCKPGPVLSCDDAKPCTADACDPKAGCTHTPGSGPCDADGNACTVGDSCQNGACVAGSAKSCDDGNVCTTNGCDAKTGTCTATGTSQDGKPCDADGNVCTVGDTCLAGKCVAGKATVCNDNNPCTTDACDPKQGCVSTPGSGPCQADGNACTVDACSGGVCVPGAAKVCSDDNPCTQDACNATTGACTASTGPLDGKPCVGAGGLCVQGASCQAGVCKDGPAVKCDDGNPCTTDSCDPKVGCLHANATGSCDDGSPCTGPDTCSGGKCLATPKNCDDADPCTTDACNETGACVHAPKAGCVARGQFALGGATFDTLEKAVGMPDGGFVLVGETSSFGAGNGDVLVVRTSSCGQPLWAKAYGGAGKDTAFDVAAAADGNLYVVGQSMSSEGSGNLLVLKLDGAGNKLWSAQVGGSSYDFARGVAATSDGGCIVAGKTYSFGKNTPTYHNGLIVKLSATGALQWGKVFAEGVGSMDTGRIREVFDADGLSDGYLVVGGSEGAGAGADDVWIMRLSSTGSVKWSNAYGGAMDDDPAGFALTPDGGAMVAFAETGFTATKTDVGLMRVDAAGEVQWFKLVGGYGKDEPNSVVPLADGFLVGGYTNSFGAGGLDGFVFRVTWAGDVVLARTAGGTGDENGLALAAAASGNGMLIGGRTTSAGKGSTDAWWARMAYDTVSPCGEKALAPSKLTIASATPTKTPFSPSEYVVDKILPDASAVATVPIATALTAMCSCQ